MILFGKKLVLFKKTRQLEEKTALFLDNLQTAGELYLKALMSYFDKGPDTSFLLLKEDVSSLEKQNDLLRREIENQLYVQMILPDMRSDILRVLEGSDKIINKYESNLIDLSVEKFQVPSFLHEDTLKMIRIDLLCVSGLIRLIRKFFEGSALHEIAKDIYDGEHSVDLIAEALKERIFSDGSIALANQLQLRDFIKDIEKISDIAEDVADLLMIMAVKHSV